MAKYSDIKGFTVQTVSSDPIASQALGGAWASGGSLNAARNQLGGAGSSSASALAFGGDTDTYTEEFTAADFQIKTVTTS